MSEPISPPPPPSTPPPAPPASPSVDASQMVNGPAIALIVTAIIGVLFLLIRLVMSLMGTGLAGLNLAHEGSEQFDRYVRMMAGGAGVVFSLVGIAIGAFIIWAMMQMRQLKGWTVSLVASIVAMLPCISPCCILGIPFGIWSLVVLLKPEVKAAFTD